jgi:hypothetical protein
LKAKSALGKVAPVTLPALQRVAERFSDMEMNVVPETKTIGCLIEGP